MNTSSILIILGLILDIIGVWFIAVDILKRPRLLNDAHSFHRLKRIYLDHMAHIRKATLNLPAVYTDEHKKEIIDDVENRWQCRIEELENEEQLQLNQAGWLGFNYAILGLVIVTAGFLIQIAGVIVGASD